MKESNSSDLPGFPPHVSVARQTCLDELLKEGGRTTGGEDEGKETGTAREVWILCTPSRGGKGEAGR